MARKICWKKGMRLTEEILNASDACLMEFIGKAIILASSGRMGLFPGVHPFQVSLSINKNIVSIDSLDCLAITKSGDLIDTSYTSDFTSTFNTRVPIPNTEEKSLLLTISAHADKWHDTNDGYCEQAYSFSLIEENSTLPDNSFPIARLVNEYGWRMDDIDFVPPCLYIASHKHYKDEFERFRTILNQIERTLANSIDSECKTAIGIFWPVVRQLTISLDKERDFMTPMALLGIIQKCVAAFVCGCTLDAHINLSDIETFEEFTNSAYNNRDVGTKIKDGIDLCSLIQLKVERFNEIEVAKPTPKPTPTPPTPPTPTPAPKPRAGWMGIEI